MSKFKKKAGRRTVVLNPAQRQSPDTMTPDELEARRERIAAQPDQSAQRGFTLLNEGAALLQRGEAAEAALKLEQAIALLPDNVEAAINLGGAYILQRRYNKAETVLARASLLAPENPMVWTNLAAAHLGSLALSGPQQQAKAIAAYRRVLTLDPSASNVHYNLGLIYHDRRDYAEARASFQEALAINPADDHARIWLKRLDEIESAPPAPDSEAAPDEMQ